MKCLKCGAELTENTTTIAASFFQIGAEAGSGDKVQVTVECDFCHAEMFQLLEEEDLVLADE